MRLLITRPFPEGHELARRLTALGHDVTSVPFMTIRYLPEPAGLPRPAALAATSRNGVRALTQWTAAEGWTRLPFYVVGAATAAEAREAGFTDVRSASGGAAALARFIRGDAKPGAGPILYVAGVHRSVDLAKILAGFSVITVEGYDAEARPGDDDQLAELTAAGRARGDFDGVLLFSRRTAELFLQVMLPRVPARFLARPTYYVLSRQVAEPLTAAIDNPRIEVAPHPNEDSLIALLNRPVAPGG